MIRYALAGFFAVIAIALQIIACTLPVDRPDIDSPGDAIVVTSVDLKAMADTVRQLCQNTVPDGECAPGAPLSTQDKERAKVELLRAQSLLESADALLVAGESVAADDQLALVDAILRELLRQLPTEEAP